MNSFRYCIKTVLLSIACTCPIFSQEIARNEVLPDSPGYRMQQAATPLPIEENEQPIAAGNSSIHGFTTDAAGDAIPDAKIRLEGEGRLEPRTTTSGPNGGFSFTDLHAGRYSLIISGSNLEPYDSGEFNVGTNETFQVPQLALKFVNNSTVTVNVTAEEIAQEQVHEQEKQRVLGIVPNFYTSYIWDAAPMNAKQKYSLSAHALADPAAFVIVGAIAGAEQIHGTYPGYGDGPEGYGKRYGAALADATIGRFLGGAVFPAIFHQDPRYFYQGSGGIRSRTWHALSSAFVARSDKGKNQPAYSHLLGNLIAGSIANTYHPESSRGGGLTFRTLAITTGGSAVSNLFREFLFRRLSPSVPAFAKGRK